MVAMNISPGVSVNLNLLQAFLLVAEHLSFKEAAERISRSQSAVSFQVKQLEEQLGVPLFNRTTRNVTLTPYGEILLKSARQGVNELTLGFRKLREEVQWQEGRVLMACSPTIAGTRLPSILKLFETAHPGVNVALSEMPLIKMVDALAAGAVDFGLGPVFPCTADTLRFEPVMTDPFTVIVPASYPIAEKAVIALDDLADLPILMSTKTSVTRQIFEGSVKRSGINLVTKYECTQHQTLVAMVKAGLGIAVIPQTVASALNASSVRAVPLDDPTIARQIALITVRGQRLPRAASQLAALIRREISRVPNVPN